MSTAVKASRIDESLWVRHQPMIERLYIKEHKRLEGKDGVLEYMRKHHNFAASKSQYENHFKKWRLRKNLTSVEWRQTIRHMKQNSLSGEQVKLLFKGAEIPRERIIREIARYGSTYYRDGLDNEGTYRLPRDVVIQPQRTTPMPELSGPLPHTRPQAADMSMSIQLIQPVAADAPQGSTVVTMSELAITPSSSNDTIPQFGQFEITSWKWNFDWSFLLKKALPSHELTTWTLPLERDFDAMFYPVPQGSMALFYGNGRTSIPLYHITMLINSMNPRDGESQLDDAYQWLKELPPLALSLITDALPAPVLDALKERVLVVAIEVGDAAVVQRMLALNVDVRENFKRSEGSYPRMLYPFMMAIVEGQVSIATMIVKYMCQGATLAQKDEMLEAIIDWSFRKSKFLHVSNRMPLTDPEVTDLVCHILSEGAEPDLRYIAVANGDFDLVQKILESGTGHVRAWIRAGLLEAFVHKTWNLKDTIDLSLAEKILRYALHENCHQLPREDHEFRGILLRAMQCASTHLHSRCYKILHTAFADLGYRIDEDSGIEHAVPTALIQACRNIHPDPSIPLSTYQDASEKGLAVQTDNTFVGSDENPEELAKCLNRAMVEDNMDYACALLGVIGAESAELLIGDDKFFEKAISLGHIGIVTEVIHRIRHLHDKWQGAISLLAHGRTAAVSALLLHDPGWSSALDIASRLNDFEELEHLVFANDNTIPLLPCISSEDGEYFDTRDSQQFSFRILAYHASETNDYNLYRWLLECGLDSGELLYSYETERLPYFSKRPVFDCSFGPFSQHLDSCCVFPSLLAIAAEQNNTSWMEFLLAEGAETRDSMALLRAIWYKSEVNTIELLLKVANGKTYIDKGRYGSAALREAIRHNDTNMVSLLCTNVEIDGIESSTEHQIRSDSDERVYSPLGQAILMRSINMSQILLEKGANANSLITCDGLLRGDVEKNTGSYMVRVTPLLGAISTRSLPLVELLVEHGAKMEYSRNHGITRTPLQRAAETGQLDIVRYLVTKGALIDSRPVYSGATALQLAAMNGYVGIATFLLEQGANPNYPPARGAGRTAFEAAAEWGRIDAMSMLMQAGVQLDMKVGTPPETQYDRAVRFAEENGLPASKRFVQHLYMQTTEKLSDEDARILGLLQSPIIPNSPVTSSPFRL